MCVWGGGGVGDRLERPVKSHSIFVVVLFACVVVVFVRFGGSTVDIVSFIK